MALSELDYALDAMQLAAGSNPDLMPGLITVKSNHWVQVLSDVGSTCARLDEGLRHRDVQTHVGSAQEAQLFTRRQGSGAGHIGT